MSETQHVAGEQESVVKLKSFWTKNQNLIVGVVAALAILIGGYFGYNKFIAEPREAKAELAIYKAEQYFQVAALQDDSTLLRLALNGDGTYKGFLYVAKEYKGSKPANLAKYYAGVCYLKLGDFNNAVNYLKEFSTDAKQIQMMALGCLGDAYSELGKNNEAIESYKKASSIFDTDELNASEYLFRAALLSETAGKTKEAIELYKEVKSKFPNTEKGFQSDKYIYRLTVEKNDFSVK